jgi:hypothetical protein
VAADVAEGAQDALLVANQQHGLAAGLGGDVAAGLRQARHVGGELPGALEDALLLELDDLRIAVEPSRKRLRTALQSQIGCP